MAITYEVIVDGEMYCEFTNWYEAIQYQDTFACDLSYIMRSDGKIVRGRMTNEDGYSIPVATETIREGS